MESKINLFMVMTDYQLQLALTCINQFHHRESNMVLFFYRKTSLIDYLKLNDGNTVIFPLNGQEDYRKPRILFGILNEMKRIKNHWMSLTILKRKEVKKIYLSIEEEHFLATVSWILKTNKNASIIHLEEGSVVHIDPDLHTNSSVKTESFIHLILKSIRDILRLSYFGKNQLKSLIGETYGRSSFYKYALVLSASGLSKKLAGSNHVQLDHKIFSEALHTLFNFNSSMIHINDNEEKILLLISDGEESINPFDSQVYQEIVNSISNLSFENGYKVILKNHPIYSGYLNNLDDKITIITENLPVEYYLTKWKSKLLVVGGNSTSLGVSQVLGIPTYSFLTIYNNQSRFAKLNGISFLTTHKIIILKDISDIFKYS